MRAIFFLLSGIIPLSVSLWFGHLYLTTIAGLKWQETLPYSILLIATSISFVVVAFVLADFESKFSTPITIAFLTMFSTLAGLFYAGALWGPTGRATALQSALRRGEKLICENRTISPEEVDKILLKERYALSEEHCYVKLKDGQFFRCGSCVPQTVKKQINLSRARAEAEEFKDVKYVMCGSKILSNFQLNISAEGCQILKDKTNYPCRECVPLKPLEKPGP